MMMYQFVANGDWFLCPVAVESDRYFQSWIVPGTLTAHGEPDYDLF